jgi:hypothetical protein
MYYDDPYKVSTQKVNQAQPLQYRAPNPYSWYESLASNWIPKFDPKKPFTSDKKALEDITNKWGIGSTAWYAQSPTRWTPQFQERMIAGTAANQQAQTDKATGTIANRFAQSGLYNQGAEQAAQRSAINQGSSASAQAIADIMNNMNNERYQDYIDWFKNANQRGDSLRQYDLNKQMAGAQISAMSRKPPEGGFDWTSLIAPAATLGAAFI